MNREREEMRQGRLIVEFDTVRFHGDLSSSVRLDCQLVTMAEVNVLTPRFFLFFSFLNPAPRVTIKSLDALAP
jgi:hypothetical protein